jgi:hypothetical protein
MADLEHRGSERNAALDTDPMDVPRVIAVVVNGIVHRAAVVPHNHIAVVPLMTIDIVGLDRVLV